MNRPASKIRSLHRFARIQASVLKDATLLQFKTNVRLTISAIAFVFGYIGYLKLSPPADFYGHVDIFYKTLELLVIHMPKEYPHLPIELQIARFALPATMAWLAIGTYLDYIRRPLRHYAATNLVGHVVVFGLGRRAQMIAKQARLASRKVVVATSQPIDGEIHSLEACGVIVVAGDIERPETFILAGVSRAAEMLVSTGDDFQNLRLAVAARKYITDARPPGMTPIVLVTECAQPDMAAILEGAFLSIRDERVEYRLLSPEGNVARGLLHRLIPMLGTPERPGAILLVGFSVVMQAIFEHVLRNAPPGCAIAIASSNATKSKEAFVRRCPAFENFPCLDFIDDDVIGTPAQVLSDWLMRHRAPLPIIDMGKEELNLRAALALRRFASERALPTGPAFVRQEGSGIALEALTLIEGEPIDLSRIYQFGSLEDECRPQVVFQGELDSLAMIIHDDYRRNVSGGESAFPWEKLKETYREASRHQADHLDAKLQAMGIFRVPAGDIAGLKEFEADEIEHLAHLEHHRWCMDRWLDGWKVGTVKDSLAQTHPALIPYPELSEEVKEFDRRAVRNLPHLAAAVGTCLKRVRRLPVDVRSFDAASLLLAIRQFQTDNELPFLEIEIGSEDGFNAARWAIENDAAFEAVVSLPVSKLRQKVDWKKLKPVLEAAVRVEFSM